MRIRVDNYYGDGTHSTQIYDLDETELPDEVWDAETGMDSLWDHLWEYTGDGNGEHLNAVYEVTIVDSANSGWVGQSYEWA